MILLIISLIAGVFTVLAPCVLPLLPVIVGGSMTEGVNKRRAFVISFSLGVSVVLFTLLLKVSSLLINIPQSAWQWFSGGILLLFGLVMLFPHLWDSLGFVNVLNRRSNKALAAGYKKNSFWGDVLMGAALGPVFASCSPTYFVILATVLPASFGMGLLDLIAYAIGLSGSLLVIALLGQRLVDRLGIVIVPEGWFRRGIGILFLIVGLAVATGGMARVEAYLLEKGFDVTAIEQRLLGANENNAQSTAPQEAGRILSTETKSLLYPKAPELVSPDGYINTGGKPITLAELRGKVVLLDIWTYSCINCQRTFPYLKDWYAKYKDQGLEIIGVHTPEFAFEKIKANVEKASQGFGLTYPIVLDNEYQTWNAFGNQFWPRKYLIDIDGYIVYDHAGEGNYAEAESAIRRALAELAARTGTVAPMPEITSVAEADRRVGSPEIYFGALRNEYLGNIPDASGVFTVPANPRLNTLYLGGTWSIESEFAKNTSAGARIVFRYSSKEVYFVASSDTAVKIKVTWDGGKPLGSVRGTDVDANGEATIQESRLYKLIEGTDYGAHTIEIWIESPGLKAYTFTFG